jgi:hypothetical protein
MNTIYHDATGINIRDEHGNVINLISNDNMGIVDFISRNEKESYSCEWIDDGKVLNGKEIIQILLALLSLEEIN